MYSLRHYIGVRSGIWQSRVNGHTTARTDNRKNFKRAWTRFELLAKAKEWNAAKQLIVLPTLLQGKLVDYYTEFDDDTKGNIGKIRLTLAKATGRVEDPLVADRTFVSC